MKRNLLLLLAIVLGSIGMASAQTIGQVLHSGLKTTKNEGMNIVYEVTKVATSTTPGELEIASIGAGSFAKTYNGRMIFIEKVTWPNTSLQFNVTSIAQEAFSEHKHNNLSFKGGIELPKTIKTIGRDAFYDAITGGQQDLDLTKMNSGDVSIGDLAFRGCKFNDVIFNSKLKAGQKVLLDASINRLVYKSISVPKAENFEHNTFDRLDYNGRLEIITFPLQDVEDWFRTNLPKLGTGDTYLALNGIAYSFVYPAGSGHPAGSGEGAVKANGLKAEITAPTGKDSKTHKFKHWYLSTDSEDRYPLELDSREKFKTLDYFEPQKFSFWQGVEDAYYADKSVEIVAVMEAKKEVTYTFKPNGGAEGDDYVIKGLEGDKFTFPNVRGAGFTPKAGFEFDVWTPVPHDPMTSYDPGEEGTFGDSNETMYALWHEVPTITITFDANGGKGTMGAIKVNANSHLGAIPENKFTRDGYTFLGWAYDKNATEEDRDDMEALDVGTKDITLYAVWKRDAVPSIVTLTYHSNDASAKTTKQDVNVENENPATLGATAFTRTGYTLVGWNTAADGTGKDYAFNVKIGAVLMETFLDGKTSFTLYAVWKEVPADMVTITFDANGGKGVMSTQVVEKGTVVKLTKNSFTYDNSTFKGWSTDKNADSLADIDYDDEESLTVNSDLTLYAVWSFAVGVEDVEDAQIRVDGRTIYLPTMQQLSIYDFAGKLIYNGRTDRYTIDAPAGYYIIATDDARIKITIK